MSDCIFFQFVFVERRGLLYFVGFVVFIVFWFVFIIVINNTWQKFLRLLHSINQKNRNTCFSYNQEEEIKLYETEYPLPRKEQIISQYDRKPPFKK